MPTNRIIITSVIKKIFNTSGFIQDFRMVRFLSENDKPVNSGLLLEMLYRSRKLKTHSFRKNSRSSLTLSVRSRLVFQLELNWRMFMQNGARIAKDKS